jgi:hypothetical protein
LAEAVPAPAGRALTGPELCRDESPG